MVWRTRVSITRRCCRPPLRHRLGRWLLRATGSSVLIVCLACGLALATWSAADPSLTHATSGSTRNLFGPLGAILSDLLMQMLGLAGVLVLLPPLFWALPLSSGRPLEAWRGKLALAPVAIVAIAGAISSLPTSVTWTLHHGNGGMIGDLVFTLLASALAPLNGDKAGVTASLILFGRRCHGPDWQSRALATGAGSRCWATRLRAGSSRRRAHGACSGVGCRGQGRCRRFPPLPLPGGRSPPCIAASGCKKSRARFGPWPRSTRRPRPTLPRSAAAPMRLRRRSIRAAAPLRSALRRPASSPCLPRSANDPQHRLPRARRLSPQSASWSTPPATAPHRSRC